MRNIVVPRRLLPLFLAVIITPCIGAVFIDINIFIDNAISTAYIESIEIGVVGVVLLGIALLSWSSQRPLALACYFGGLIALVSSAVFLLLIGQPWLGFGVYPLWQGIIPFGLSLVGTVALVRRDRMVAKQPATTAIDISSYLALIPTLKGLRRHSLWSYYDPEADTLAIHFTVPDAPNIASDSDMTDDDIIVSHDDTGEVIGLTILHASSRKMS